MTLVKDIFRISKGKKVSTTVSIPNSSSARYIQIGDLRNDNNLKYTDETNLVAVNETDVVIAWDGAYAGTIGFGLSGIIGSTLARLSIKENYRKNCNAKYLGYFLSGNFTYFQNTATGATIPHVSRKALEKLNIHLPDLETQNKIVAILDKANALVQKRQQTIDLLQDLLDAQFYFSFGEPYQNPLQWPTKLLDEITLNIKSGWSIGGDQRQKKEDELGVLKVSAVTSGIFKPEEHKAVPKENITRELVTPKKGDLLFSRANTIELVGATCIVDKDYDDLFLPDKLWRIDIDETLVTKEYVKAVLTSPIYRKNFVRTATGSSGSMLNISQAKFKSAKIPIPTIEAQRKYSKLFWKIHEHKEILLRSLQEINVLLYSILQRAFSGNLDFDVKTELDALLEEIDLQKPENDLYSILSNEEYVNSLVERLNTQDFENQDLYDKAKHVTFQLLKTDEILTQQYDEASKSVKLIVK